MTIINKIKKNIWAVSLLLVRIAAGLSMQKIIALKYGPVGTTLFSHFQNFLGLFTQPLQDIIGQGLITGIGKKSLNNKAVVKAATFFSLIITSTVAFGAVIYIQFNSSVLSFLVSYWPIILLALIFITIKLVVVNLLVAKEKIKEIFFITAVEWLLVIFIIFFFTSELTLTLLWYISIQGVSAILFLLVIFKSVRKLLPLNFSICKDIKKHFFQFFIIGITIWTSSKLTDFYVRSFAINTFPELATGLWQAVARVSEAYKGLFISFSMLTFFPAISKAINTSDRRKVLLNYLKTYLPAVITFIIFVFLIKTQLLSLLYDPAYVSGSALFSLQLLGDILALLSIPFSLLLLAVVNAKRFILAEIISAIIFITAVHLLSNSDIKILLYAYFIRYLIYLTLVVSLSRKYWGIA